MEAIPHQASDTGGEEAVGRSSSRRGENYYGADEISDNNNEEEIDGDPSEGGNPDVKPNTAGP